MGDFVKASVGTFSKELQALIDYGHDCCARIDDRIHECCQRIREAHDVEVGSYQNALTLMHKTTLPQYDVLGNERHKAVCKLREMPDNYPDYSAFPFAKWYEDLSTALGIDKGEVSCAKVRDTLIHLLGGDLKQAKLGDLYGIWKEEQDAVDAGGCVSAGDGGDVHAAAGRVDNCADDQLAEEVAPITVELRGAMEKDENRVQLSKCLFEYLCDAIDAVHNGLERENKELRHDVEMWRDRALDMRMERDDALKEHHAWAPESHYVMLPRDADGVPIHIGDVMEWVDIEGTVEVTCTVEAVGVGCFFAWDKANKRFAQKLATSYRHHKPDTWEQIIEDALDGYHDTDFDALVARCKALAGDADE